MRVVPPLAQSSGPPITPQYRAGWAKGVELTRRYGYRGPLDGHGGGMYPHVTGPPKGVQYWRGFRDSIRQSAVPRNRQEWIDLEVDRCNADDRVRRKLRKSLTRPPATSRAIRHAGQERT